jgi:dTDP-4-dehydrorhamnose reductase
MAVEVARHLHLDEQLIVPVTESEWPQPARRPPHTVFRLDKARRLLGYEPVSFSEGLKRTFA